ncbi:MAG: hypothetical protein LUQ07_03370 [Methanospirillum sp.]|nr:hypothetical protein [Methanospirillum sp.]
MAVSFRMLFCIICGLVLLAGGVALASGTGAPSLSSDITTPPANLTVSVQLDQEGKYITATFRGGLGQTLLKEIQVQVRRPDGTTETKSLGNIIGESVVLDGSGCGDQVTATAFFKTGASYQILNEKTEYIVGICSADYKAPADPCAAIAQSPYLVPATIQEIPSNKSVEIQANVDISSIDVQFRGGFGQNLIKQLQVSRIAPDGSTETKNLGNRVGDEVTFSASNNCMDRIAANVSFMDGTRYHFYDQVLHISRTI